MGKLSWNDDSKLIDIKKVKEVKDRLQKQADDRKALTTKKYEAKHKKK